MSDNGNTGYNPTASDRNTENLPYVLKDALTLPVEVLNRQDVLHITVPDAVVHCQEDSTGDVSGVSFIDQSLKKSSTTLSGKNEGSRYRLDISSGEGELELRQDVVSQSELDTTFTYDHFVETGWSHVVATGQLYDLNHLVHSLYFTPSRDFNILNGGLAKITLVLTDVDSELLLKESNYNALISDNKLTNEEIIMLESNTVLADSITSATLYVHVNATDDPPEVHVPGEIYAANPTQIDGKRQVCD